MSYTPTLIIKKRDLERNKQLLSDYWQLKEDSDERKAKEMLYELSKNPFHATVSRIELVLCHPETSQLNKEIRFLMERLDIEYGTYN